MAEILDLIVIVLLVVTLVYGYVLNKKINLIKDSKKELSKLFKSFDNTILKAQEGVAQLKAASEEASHGLQQNIDKAVILVDDLSFMSEKAENVSSQAFKRVEELKASVKSLQKSSVASVKAKKVVSAKPAAKKLGSGPLSPDEVRQIRQKNKSKDTKAASKGSTSGQKKVDNRSKKEKTQALEEILTKIADNKKVVGTNDNRSKKVPTKGKESKGQEIASVLKSLGFGDS